MDKRKLENLKSKGWKETSVSEFLNLSLEEEKIIEKEQYKNEIKRLKVYTDGYIRSLLFAKDSGDFLTIYKLASLISIDSKLIHELQNAIKEKS